MAKIVSVENENVYINADGKVIEVKLELFNFPPVVGKSVLFYHNDAGKVVKIFEDLDGTRKVQTPNSSFINLMKTYGIISFILIAILMVITMTLGFAFIGILEFLIALIPIPLLDNSIVKSQKVKNALIWVLTLIQLLALLFAIPTLLFLDVMVGISMLVAFGIPLVLGIILIIKIDNLKGN